MEDEVGQKKKSILRAVGIETIFLGVIILIIIGILSFLNIIPLSKINPILFGWMSQEQKLVVVSDIPRYKVSINNSDDFLKLINQWNLYGKNFSIQSGSTENIPLKSIRIHLVSNDQFINAYQSNGSTYLSSSIKISRGRFDIYVYLSNNILTDNSKFPAQKNTLLAVGVITALARLNEYVIYGKNDPTKNFNEVLKKLDEDKKTYFKIEKK